MGSQRLRNFCFTSFLRELPDLLDRAQFTYLIMQQEVCPDTGREHWQGYAELSKQTRFDTIKDYLGDPAVHIEKRRGTAQQAADYCKKDRSRASGGETVEFGSLSRPGTRSDITYMVDLIKEGKSNLDLIERVPGSFCRYFKGVDRIRMELDSKEARAWRDLQVHVLYGETGTGKTRYVYANYPIESIYKLDVANNLWWDGYHGENVLLIDDFYGWIKYGQLLNVLDGYPFRCEVKGGFCWAKWTIVYLTSNRHPSTWFKQMGLTPALARRITDMQRCDSPDSWVDEPVLPCPPAAGFPQVD